MAPVTKPGARSSRPDTLESGLAERTMYGRKVSYHCTYSVSNHKFIWSERPNDRTTKHFISESHIYGCMAYQFLPPDVLSAVSRRFSYGRVRGKMPPAFYR